jgi:hypothetical protein
MISNSKHSPPTSKGRSTKRTLLAVGGITVSLVLFGILARMNLEETPMIACIAYAVVVSLFMAAQLWGFVVSQTTYSEVVEEPKFRLIEIEESEWKK